MWSVRRQMAIVWALLTEDWRHSTLTAVVWEHRGVHVQTNDNKSLLCGVIVNSQQIKLALSRGRRITTPGCWQWWRLKPSLMEHQRGMGLCQRADQDRPGQGFRGEQRESCGLRNGPESRVITRHRSLTGITKITLQYLARNVCYLNISIICQQCAHLQVEYSCHAKQGCSQV